MAPSCAPTAVGIGMSAQTGEDASIMAMGITERRDVVYVSTCHALIHIVELAYGVVLIAMAKDLGMTLLTLGVLANVFGLVHGITALPIDVIADRMSATKLLAPVAGRCPL